MLYAVWKHSFGQGLGLIQRAGHRDVFWLCRLIRTIWVARIPLALPFPLSRSILVLVLALIRSLRFRSWVRRRRRNWSIKNRVNAGSLTSAEICSWMGESESGWNQDSITTSKLSPYRLEGEEITVNLNHNKYSLF